MNKTYVTLFGIFLFTSMGNATEVNLCPDISGQYTCTGLKEILELKIVQNNNEFTMDLGNGPMTFIADNQQKETLTTQDDTQIYTTVYNKCVDQALFSTKRIKTIHEQDIKEVDTFFVFFKIDFKNLTFYTTTEFLVNNDISKPIENKLHCTKN